MMAGNFYIETSDLETFTFRPPRLLAVVFISETQHGFKESTRGARETFATELLIHDDATFGMKRLNFHEWSRMLREFKGQGYLDDYDNNELIEAEEDANNQYGYTNAEEEHGDEYDSTDSEDEFVEYDGEGQDELKDSEEEYEDENTEFKNYDDEYDSTESEEEYEEHEQGHEDNYEHEMNDSEEDYEDENREVTEYDNEYDSTDSE